MRILQTRPVKTLYILTELVTVLVFRLPYWILYSIPKSNRPRPSWSIFRCVLIYALRRHFIVNYIAGGVLNSPDYRAIRQGKNVNAAWIEPAPELVVGNIRERADQAGVDYVKLPAYWFTKKGSHFDPEHKLSKNEKVVYSLHGGGFVSFSAHPSDPLSTIRQGIVDLCPGVSRILSLEYRLAKLDVKNRQSTNSFPTQLVDAIAGYNFLVNQMGYSPQNVIFEGDSAGANLAMALVRYLIENPLPTLPPPGGLILVSPWTDLSLSHITAGSSALPSVPADVLGATKWGPGNSWYSVRAYVGMDKLSAAKTDPYISPASLEIQNVDFKRFPNTLMVYGTAELFYDQAVTLRERMREDMGDRLQYYEAADAVHDYLCITQFEPERTETLKRIASWVSSN